MFPKVIVVLLNWNGFVDTIDCLNSLLQQEYSGEIGVVVIDNMSMDDSVTQIKSWAKCNGVAYHEFEFTPEVDDLEGAVASCKSSAWLNVIRSVQNIGFCLGNNIGLAFAKTNSADYGLILNNDTTVDSKAIAKLVEAARLVGQPALISPSILYADNVELVWWGGGKFTRFLSPIYLRQGEVSSKTLQEISKTDWVSGCATFVPISVYDEIGGYDPIFFIWCEEWDLSLRARNSGVQLRMAPAALVYHKVGRSLGVVSPLTFYYSLRNMIYLRRRYLTKLQYCLFSFFFLPYKFFQSIVMSLKLKNKLYFLAMMDIFLGRNVGTFGRWIRQAP